jgi:hypothetical protein
VVFIKRRKKGVQRARLIRKIFFLTGKKNFDRLRKLE